MKTLVVAKYLEDVSWCLDLRGWDVALYDKGNGEIPNVGREANTYLRHIVDCYGQPPAETVFCQGHPFDHDSEFLRHLDDPQHKVFGALLDVTIGGAYDALSFVHEYCHIFSLPVQPTYPFVAGAQFRVTAEQIRSHSLEFYKALLALTAVDTLAPYTLERLWLTIFGIRP